MGSSVTWSLLSWDYQKSKNWQKLVNSCSRKHQTLQQNLWGSWQVVPGICQAPSYWATFRNMKPFGFNMLRMLRNISPSHHQTTNTKQNQRGRCGWWSGLVRIKRWHITAGWWWLEYSCKLFWSSRKIIPLYSDLIRHI